MGVSLDEVLQQALTADERRQVDLRAAELQAEHATLRDLRRAMELTQVRLASDLGITQKNVSLLERRSDALISTLRNYVEAMGGTLELMVRFPDRPPVRLDGFSGNGPDEARDAG